MSDFITDRDPETQHDWIPGHIQPFGSYYREKAGRLQTMICDMQEDDARANDGAGSQAYMVLAEIGNDLMAGRITDANNLATENGLTLPGLPELLKEMLEDEHDDRPDYYPGVR